MTKEEAIHFANCLKNNYTIDFNDMEEFCDMVIKALEQEPVIDKIRAEIEKVVWEDVIVSLDGMDEVRISRLEPDDVFEIIDKYRGESEGKE